MQNERGLFIYTEINGNHTTAKCAYTSIDKEIRDLIVFDGDRSEVRAESQGKSLGRLDRPLKVRHSRLTAIWDVGN